MYKKVVKDGYIIAIGTNLIGDDISVNEYATIKTKLISLQKKEGKGYKLREDLTWEEFDLPNDI